MSVLFRRLSLSLLALPLLAGCAYFGFGGNPNARELSRADYSLEPSKAEALSNFLSTQLAVEIETKVVADTITITTSPEAQAVIAEFVALMADKPVIRVQPQQTRKVGPPIPATE